MREIMVDRTIAYYEKNAKEFCRATSDADMSFCRDKFLSLLEQKNSMKQKERDRDRTKIHILDAGCGSGRDAKAFLEAGYQVTALDASKKICEEAEKLLKQEVFCMKFEKLKFAREFDGIWACASLLHVSYTEIDRVLKRFWNALKDDGILYCSFKYGKGTRNDKGRLFYDYDEIALKNILINNCFSVEEIFITHDVRKDRESEQWLNALVQKVCSKEDNDDSNDN